MSFPPVLSSLEMASTKLYDSAANQLCLRGTFDQHSSEHVVIWKFHLQQQSLALEIDMDRIQPPLDQALAKGHLQPIHQGSCQLSTFYNGTMFYLSFVLVYSDRCRHLSPYRNNAIGIGAAPRAIAPRIVKAHP